MTLITPEVVRASETGDQQYLRVALRTEELGEVVRRDFLLTDAFGPLVEKQQSELIGSGILEEGSLYCAVIIPRFGSRRDSRPKVTIDEKKVAEWRDRWISFEFEEELKPQEAMTYFSLEIRVVEKNILYRTDCSISDLDFILKRLEPVLVKTGVMKKGDTYIANMFARQDGDGNFRREEMSLLKQRASELIELGPVELATPVYPVKGLGAFEIDEIVGTPRADDNLKIVIHRGAFEQTKKVACGGATVEEGGILVGTVFQYPEGTGFLVEITDQIFSEEAKGSHLALRYTFESWKSQRATLRSSFPGKRTVGWYHTHLVTTRVRDTATGTYSETEIFFSQDDHFMHGEFFKEKWYVALVLSPKGEAGFFRWNADQIIPAEGFYVARS